MNEDDLSEKVFERSSDLKTDLFIGAYNHLISGYVKDEEIRINSSSGGLATWLLNELLRIGEIDYAVCVTPTPNSNVFFKFDVFSDVQGVQQSSKSCYYPVHMSEIVKFILKTPGRYAITGLPCYIKAIRLLMMRNKKFSGRVKYLFGLVCGQTQSKYFINYLYSIINGEVENLSEVQFRIKSHNKPANNFGIRFLTSDPKATKELFWNEGMGDAWKRGYFRPEACNYCDDIFAELADITFMDAWLPNFIRDPAGTNFVIVRNQKLKEIFEKANVEGRISTSPTSAGEIHMSQKGVITKKREELAYRLYLSRSKGYFPKKRVLPNDNKSLHQKIIFHLNEWIRINGNKASYHKSENIYSLIQRRTSLPSNILLLYSKTYKLYLKILNRLRRRNQS